MKENLKNVGLICHSKLLSLTDKDTAKQFFETTDKLFGFPLDEHTRADRILARLFAFQQQVSGILKEGQSTNVLNVLSSLHEQSNFCVTSYVHAVDSCIKRRQRAGFLRTRTYFN
ncbi:hypothetical protein PR048_007236 [Dryococelus australis]|uniref:Uncharacterized protein n=1 Tax=Dryococelus australis TaxID=614101 RepID=A0ABQ9ID20_9NEOP|nr:hypothetical protein PR048_007236 [Dryococelus australis]